MEANDTTDAMKVCVTIAITTRSESVVLVTDSGEGEEVSVAVMVKEGSTRTGLLAEALESAAKRLRDNADFLTGGPQVH